MRLLNVDSFTFTEFFGQSVPLYAIASHRWTAGAEAMWADVQHGNNTDSIGYRKIAGFAAYIRSQLPQIEWLWIDTCCIKQDSDRELSESINSMFHYYREAEVCLAYLEDVHAASDDVAFKQSIWFRRGWTLQELLAPATVIFLSKAWQVIGHKGFDGHGRSGYAIHTGPTLERCISAVTKIPQDVLQNYHAARRLPTEVKLAWMNGRSTTREEDMSYCLLGILDVSMNIRYGEGFSKTQERLQRKMIRRERPWPMLNDEKYRIPMNLKDIPSTEHFMPRDSDTQQLTSFFTRTAATYSEQRIFEITGDGGMGKTQLCANFVKEHAIHFSAVFWFDGTSEDTLQLSMALAVERIPGAADASPPALFVARRCNILINWLSRPDNTDWLIVIDNVCFGSSSHSAEVETYNYCNFLPKRHHGNVLVNSRQNRLPKPRADLHLEPVENRLAREIIEARAGCRLPDIAKLLPRLGGSPLALTLAGAYIKASSTSVLEYLSEYISMEQELQQGQSRVSSRDLEKRSASTAWSVSYRRIKSIDKTAAKLLNLWAFLHHGDVWIELASQLVTNAFSSLIIEKLVQYSLVNPGTASRPYSVNPSMNEWCLENVENLGPEQEMLFDALVCIARLYVLAWRGPTSKQLLCCRLAAHASAISRKMVLQPSNESYADACALIADLLNKEVKLEGGEDLRSWVQRSYERRPHAKQEIRLSDLADFTVTSRMNSLYTTSNQQRELAIVGELDVFLSRDRAASSVHSLLHRVLAIQESILGVEHPLTLHTLHRLGIFYLRNSPNLAEERFSKASSRLPSHKSSWREEYERLVCLGCTYMRQKKPLKARKQFKQALQTVRDIGGVEHDEDNSLPAAILDEIDYGFGMIWHGHGSRRARLERARQFAVRLNDYRGPHYNRHPPAPAPASFLV